MQIYANRIQLTDIADVVHEVNQHGFYLARCVNLVSDARNLDEQVRAIKKLAAQVHLQVSFNTARNLCIFEGYVANA